MPKAWRAAVQAWRQYNSVYKSFATGGKAPDAVDEYLLYQTLVGTWPLDLAPDDSTGLEAYGQRLIQWQRKAVREAKRRSGWTEPNVAYEDGCENFLQQILNPRLSAAFLREVTGFVDRIAAAGAANGLAQTLLRLTTPGMPDLYQGCELWDFSLVDPDNRRPVDYAGRARLLETTDAPEQLLRQWRDGRIKQRLIQRALAARTRQPELFGDGRYVPLAARGPLANHVVAFLRENSGRFALAAAVRHPLQLLGDARLPRPDPTHWKSTALMLPPELRDLRWQDALCDAATDALPSPVPLSDLFAQWPTALWLSL
jgi:(1->4)-alpha-D-glucan 1-alpha-D-glucosylmutase